jgi:hypothetical protein
MRRVAVLSSVRQNEGRRYEAMTTTRRARGILGVDKDDFVGVENRATAMHNGMAADTVTYTAPNPPLPAFLILIDNLGTSQQATFLRTTGAAAARDVARDLLWTAMQTELAYINSVAAAFPSRAVSIIQNAGCVVADVNPHTKAIIELSLLQPPGTVLCDANVGMLEATAVRKASANRFFNWGYTLDGGKTFLTAPSTPNGKTTISNLPLLTQVGFRVNLNTSAGPGEWSQVMYILVH